MARNERNIQVQLGGRLCEGLLTWNDSPDRRPGVLVCHTIRGRTDFEDDKARALADLGYVALAIDLYGVETRGAEFAQLRKAMDDLKAQRAELLTYLTTWVEALAGQEVVDSDRLGAIGFCFGGLCVLDIARGMDQVAGVVSFHGLFDPPPQGSASTAAISARVLALHGWEDPLATPEQVLAFTEEMTARSADWQIHAYGNTLHAFTNPAANDQAAGTVYNKMANRRSWAAMQDFFCELFPK